MLPGSQLSVSIDNGEAIYVGVDDGDIGNIPRALSRKDSIQVPVIYSTLVPSGSHEILIQNEAQSVIVLDHLVYSE